MVEEWARSNDEENFWGPQIIQRLNMIIRVGVVLCSDRKAPSGYPSCLACVAGV